MPTYVVATLRRKYRIAVSQSHYVNVQVSVLRLKLKIANLPPFHGRRLGADVLVCELCLCWKTLLISALFGRDLWAILITVQEIISISLARQAAFLPPRNYRDILSVILQNTTEHLAENPLKS